MLIIRLAFIAGVIVLLAQLPGCHYYVEGMPRFIVSSEPFQPPQTVP